MISQLLAPDSVGSSSANQDDIFASDGIISGGLDLYQSNSNFWMENEYSKFENRGTDTSNTISSKGRIEKSDKLNKKDIRFKIGKITPKERKLVERFPDLAEGEMKELAASFGVAKGSKETILKNLRQVLAIMHDGYPKDLYEGFTEQLPLFLMEKF